MGHSSLIAAFGIPHNPHFPTWVASGHPLTEEIEASYRPLREAFERARPDTLIYITSDHYNMFWETLPVFAIGAADSAYGASDYPDLQRELRIDAGPPRGPERRSRAGAARARAAPVRRGDPGAVRR